ncbi:uncharacterized protein B0H64DRAFT_440654 [Chaetomium fimeti]|uniref:Uncharacterized protein n=1 Tax=Chaetomium fimeti TaxID=1854472 RepID=A0AAE0HIP3_9PEZI|nr:hypothetical protein B0H64DRAFT_440654 [Chaetomium fimeti]
MCFWSYSHHHHLPPCTRPIEIIVNYEYCHCAVTDPMTGETQACDRAFCGDNASPMNQVDYNDPCGLSWVGVKGLGLLDNPWLSFSKPDDSVPVVRILSAVQPGSRHILGVV